MPIKGYAHRRLPRVGKIHLGIKQERGFPKQVDYFVVRPGDTTPEASALAFAEVYGDKPRELRIMFPTDDPEQWADPWLKAYSQSWGLLCRGDGEWANARWDYGHDGPRPAEEKQGTWAYKETQKWQMRRIPCLGEECLSEDTMLLTEAGWAGVQNIAIGDKILTVDDQGRYEVQAVADRVWHQHSVLLLRAKKRSLDMAVTMGHRVVCETATRRKADVLGGPHHERYPPFWRRRTVSARELPRSFRVPAVAEPTERVEHPIDDDLLQLLCWVITEGAEHGTGPYLRIVQAMRHPEMVEEIEHLLLRLFGSGRLRKSVSVKRPSTPLVQFFLGRQETTQCLRYLGESIHRVPRELLIGASPRQLRLMLATLMKGDGSGRTFYAGHNWGLANDVQEIAIRLGISARLIRNREQVAVSLAWLRRTHYVEPDDLSQEQFGGSWCVSVPNERLIARRNGTVFITGNCPMQKAKPPRCKAVMGLQFILPDVRGIGVWQIDTGSFNSIRNLQDGIELVKSATGGRIRGLPLTLRLSPKEVTPPGVKKKTVYMLDLSMPNITLEQLLAAAARLPEHALAALPPPAVDEEPPEDLFPPGDESVPAPPPEGVDEEEPPEDLGLLTPEDEESVPAPEEEESVPAPDTGEIAAGAALARHLSRTPDHDAAKCDDCKKYGAMIPAEQRHPSQSSAGDVTSPLPEQGEWDGMAKGLPGHDRP